MCTATICPPERILKAARVAANTFMLAGQSDPGDIIRSLRNGIYCATLIGNGPEASSMSAWWATI